MFRTVSRRCLAAACFVLLPCLFAQNNNGRISGTITDNTGAVIAGAAMSVINEDTGAIQKTVSDSGGFYQVAQLAVGSYRVIAEKPGFKKEEKNGNNLVDAGRLTIDFKLEVGAITDTVTVTATAAGTATVGASSSFRVAGVPLKRTAGAADNAAAGGSDRASVAWSGASASGSGVGGGGGGGGATPAASGNPGVGISLSPRTQSVASGGTARFTVTVTNSGSLSL